MKPVLTLLLSVITFSTIGQNNTAVRLQWKVAHNEKLTYFTVMSDIDTASFEMDFGILGKAFSDSTKNGLEESKAFFKRLNDVQKNQDYVTTLTNKGKGVIDIVMTTKPKIPDDEMVFDTTDQKQAEVLKMLQEMSKGVMLRGSVYETGGIHSFWIKSAQKNLIAMFFELPGKPIRVGDTWPLEVNLIANDQNFDCDTSYKINEVMLTDLKIVDGDTIAVLKYTIIEFVNGSFSAPSFYANEEGGKATMMKFTLQGVAEFSINDGRWVSYDGIMSLVATGVMTANKKTKFSLMRSE